MTPSLAVGARVVLFRDPMTCTRFDRMAIVDHLLPVGLDAYDVHGRTLMACAVRIAGERKLQDRIVSAPLMRRPLTVQEMLRQALDSGDDSFIS